MRTAPERYSLPFSRRYRVSIRALPKCHGTNGWSYKDLNTGTETRVYDNQANSYARNMAGMMDTFWLVVEICEDPKSPDIMVVTLVPS